MMAVAAKVMPLFIWPEQAKIDALADQRGDLHACIVELPRMAHRRVVLEARLAELTARQLELETEIRDRKLAR